MWYRVLGILLVLSGGLAQAKHRRAALIMPDRIDSSGNHGVHLGPLVPPVKISPTFVQLHSARVENDLMLFPPVLVGIRPSQRNAALLARGPERPPARFYRPAGVADDLELRRERDRLLLFRGPQPQGAAVGLGVGMFGVATLLSAHAPRPFRVLFDGRVHLGPAFFDGGGMGAGIAARGL